MDYIVVYYVLNPIFIPIILNKELYRLEVNLRNLNVKKKYYDIF